jgi:CubicO group peptidase (beta-lactamase class C family)
MQIHSPEAAGMSTERLTRLSNHMVQLTADNQHPGIMTLIQRKGKVVHLGKHGLMDIEAGKPIAEDTIFQIRSMTKPIIAMAVLILLEEGRLALNDPVARYIPSFANIKVETDAGLVAQNPPLSLYHLLTHTGGLTFPPGAFSQRSRSLAEAVELFAALPMQFQPGTQWLYGTAYSVLGYVIEVAADMPLADFLAERIFEPLGMTDTAFYVPPDKQARLAQLYDADASGRLIIDTDGTDYTTPTNCPSGGGGLVSTLGDYHAFCNCLINDGRYANGNLLSRKSIALMTANHLPASFLPTQMGPTMRGYGMGVQVTPSLEQATYLNTPGQYVWGGAATTIFYIDPAEALIAILMTQLASRLGWRMMVEVFPNLVYQAIVD